MGRVGAKRSKEPIDESPNSTGTTKKRKTEKRKIELQRVEVPADPYLENFCERFGKAQCAIDFLLQNAKMPIKQFFDEYWENKPLFMRAEKPSNELKKLFTWANFIEIVSKNESCSQQEKLIAEVDYLFQKHSADSIEKVNVNNISVDFCKAKYSEKFGVQFSQPQRFIDPLWAFMEKLECYFGSLVSCKVTFLHENVELARPSCKNVEKFVMQIDGSSMWTLNEFKKGPRICFDESIDSEDIGDEIMTATMQAGDVLYIPKGTIFQSTGKTEGVYLSFATYSGLSKATLLNQSIKALIAEVSLESKALQRGLPIKFLPAADSVSNADYADLLCTLAETVRSRSVPFPRPEAMIGDFMSYRLPPFGQRDCLTNSELVHAKSQIMLRNKDHIAWYTRSSTESMLTEADFDEEGANVRKHPGSAAELFVISSMNNERKLHIMLEPHLMGVQTESFVIGAEFEDILNKLRAAQAPVRVEDLKKTLEDNSIVDPLVLVRALCNIGAIEIFTETE